MADRIPIVDIGRCTLCGGCVEVAPEVFRYNDGFGYIEVVELESYPAEEVNEAIKICPVDCIEWGT